MKVLLVNGSPREKGCSNRALEECAMELNKNDIDTEMFWIGTSVQGCIGCGTCRKSGKCVFDDQVNEFVEKAKQFDGFIFASPVYFGSASGGITSFLDRVFYSGTSALAFKPVASVVSCRRGGATEAFAQLNMYYLMSNMFVVGSQYWNQVHGNIPEQVEQDLEGLQTMRTLARNMAYFIKCQRVAKDNGIELPTKEERIPTNFIR